MKQNEEPNKLKRSLSDQFNQDREVMNKLEGELLDKFEKMFGISDKPIKVKQPHDDLLAQLEAEYGVTVGNRKKSEGNLGEQLNLLKQNPPGINVKLNLGTPQLETPSKLPYILEEGQERHRGKLKFFDEQKNYGFLILDSDSTDVFVHADDLQTAGINYEKIRSYQPNTQHHIINFAKCLNQAPYLEFTLMIYMGKYNKSRKAIDLKLIS